MAVLTVALKVLGILWVASGSKGVWSLEVSPLAGHWDFSISRGKTVVSRLPERTVGLLIAVVFVI